MDLKEALTILDIGNSTEPIYIKANYKWLVKFYHPDNSQTGNARELIKVINAYNLIKRNINDLVYMVD